MNANLNTPPRTEPLLTKRELASHFRCSTRYIELRMKAGMPSYRLGNKRRFKLSEVEPWLVVAA